MAFKRKLKHLSKSTQELLETGETTEVDYKEKPASVTMDDFVAFANSSTGGCLLVGVSEVQSEDGSQKGAVIGCPVDDNTVLILLNKATECIPPVGIELSAENTAKRPIIRIDIKPSDTRPHSTRKGVYCIRDGSRNRPLLPTELLSVFLETEAAVFQERFEESVQTIEASIGELEQSLEATISSMSDQLGWADFKLDDTESLLSTLVARIGGLEKKASSNEDRLRALFSQDEREDPVKIRVSTETRARIRDYLKENPKNLEAALKKQDLSLSVSGDAVGELTKEELNKLFRDEVQKLSAESGEADSS